MNTQNRIIEIQNEYDKLRCQCTSRILFNKAENFGHIAFVFCVGSALCILIPDGTLSIFLPLVFDIFSVVFFSLLVVNQKKAATIRNYFDDIVLGLKTCTLDSGTIRMIFETVTAEEKANPKKFKEQINNTGRDNPPGVKNWYEFSKNFTENEAVFECQKQNLWWNKKLCKTRLAICSTIGIGTIVLILLSFFLFKNNRSKIIACVIGFIINISGQIKANYSYLHLSQELDNIASIPGISQNPAQLLHLQKKIDSRRELPVLELNLLHKKNSKSYSESYAQISKY